METIKVKLEAFEGPLDLLLHLIDKNEINIYDIPIAILTDQYMEYLQEYSQASFQISMEQLSEFLVMAATLLEIKSKMLLPALPKQLEEPIDPREDLVNKLVEYKRFKMVTSFFKEKQLEASDYVYKKPDEKVIEIFRNFYPLDVEELLNGITLEKLFQVFNDTLQRRELKTDVIRSGFKSIEKDLYTIEGKIQTILDLLVIYEKIIFSKVIRSGASKSEKIVTFLALLELIKRKEVSIRQENLFSEIYLYANKE